MITCWYRCPGCSHVFDIPADKPSCPRCGTRCNFYEHGFANPPGPRKLTRRSFFKFAAAAVIAVPIVKHLLPSELDFTTDSFRYKATERILPGWADGRAIYGSHYEQTDGIALNSALHPELSNYVHDDAVLTESSLEEMLIELEDSVDQTGERLIYTPTKITYSPNGKWKLS